MKRIGFILVMAALLGIVLFLLFRRDRSHEVIVGGKAPDWEAININGEKFKLSEFQGNTILIDFWGSWCLPCRAEHPALVALYKNYQGETFINGGQFKIISIAIERDSSLWKSAIKQDYLSWPLHVMEKTTNLDSTSTTLAELYTVEEVPARYLINEKGIIVGIDQSIDEIDRLLQRKKH